MRTLVILFGFASFCVWAAGNAHACSCEEITPAEGFSRAQFVFTGTVVEASAHIWTIEVDRVWKGRERLLRRARLMDVYAATDCEFFLESGQRYIVFAILAKGGRDKFYHPQVCNWTRPVQSTRVSVAGNQSVWLEDWIARERGPGEPPRETDDLTH
jgi:hypothetical protein